MILAGETRSDAGARLIGDLDTPVVLVDVSRLDSNLRGMAEPVVANVSQLFVVLAPKPAPDFFVVDRYLSAATSAGITGTLVLNKRDLTADDEIHTELAAYQYAGIETINCSARST